MTFSPPSVSGSVSSSCRRKLAVARGFTLVEVTLAIGIISFAFVAMFGLLPVGMNVSRQAMDTTLEAQIVQQLKTQALQTDFSQIETLQAADPYYFNDQGKGVEAAKDALYKTAFKVVKKTALPSGVTSERLATVTIFVLNTKGNEARASASPASAPEAKKFTILIPDNGL